MYCDLWSQYIKVRKLFKGGNYSRAKTIRGNTVSFSSFVTWYCLKIAPKIRNNSNFTKELKDGVLYAFFEIWLYQKKFSNVKILKPPSNKTLLVYFCLSELVQKKTVCHYGPCNCASMHSLWIKSDRRM